MVKEREVCIHRIKMRYRVFLNVKALCVEVRKIKTELVKGTNLV